MRRPAPPAKAGRDSDLRATPHLERAAHSDCAPHSYCAPHSWHTRTAKLWLVSSGRWRNRTTLSSRSDPCPARLRPRRVFVSIRPTCRSGVASGLPILAYHVGECVRSFPGTVTHTFTRPASAEAGFSWPLSVRCSAGHRRPRRPAGSRSGREHRSPAHRARYRCAVSRRLKPRAHRVATAPERR